MENSPEEVEKASENFTNLLPLFKSLVKNSKRKGGLERVLIAAAEFPLGKGYPRLLDQHERTLFSVFQELIKDKTTIIAHIVHNNMKKGNEDVEQEEVMAEDRNNSSE